MSAMDVVGAPANDTMLLLVLLAYPPGYDAMTAGAVPVDELVG